jgi:hypothetical protein
VTDSTALIVHPATGEALSIPDEPTDRLGLELDGVKDLESRLREYKREIWREVLRRMDHEGLWSVKAGDLKLTGASPGQVDYDARRLAQALHPFVKHELISQAAYDAAVESEVTWKAKKRGINALLKLGGVVAEAVKDCEVPIDPESRRVSVSRVVR